MKNLLYVVAGMLILGSFATIGIGEDAANTTKTIQLQFQQPIIIEDEAYVKVHVDGANTILHHTGKPILPLFTTTIILPFGTKITDVKLRDPTINHMGLSSKIIPAPPEMSLNTVNMETEPILDATVYNSDKLFPSTWFEYYTGGGLNENNEHKTFLTLRFYPVRYRPVDDTIDYVTNAEVTITYDTPQTNFLVTNDIYDLVIIAPSTFSEELQRLVDHKNNIGVPTILQTTEEIYSTYSGVDKPEQIKYFIKDAIETWGIKYVLLVGGLNSLIYAIPRDDINQGTQDWYVPVRYTNLKDSGSVYDPGFISDLYYADIYDSEGGFSSWDSNNDGVFANWKFASNKDIIDLYPDVYVGRLACRNIYEVKLMVDKIITYETTTYGQTWFKKMIVVAGDSHDDAGTNFLEGELTGDKSLSYMPEFTPVRLYASYKNTDPTHTPVLENIQREISSGSGFLLFDGHANPANWVTHWPGEFHDPETGRSLWAGGIGNYDFPGLSNEDMLPVVVVGGCHNSQFNVSFLTTFLDRTNTQHMWTYGIPIPESWSWWLTRKIGGGGIATIGSTGLGYGAVGESGDQDGDGVNEPDCVEAVGGYLAVQFFKAYNEGSDILGEAWSGAIRRYLDVFPGMADLIDAKQVEEWALLGDPSLKIGGYS